MPFLLLALGAAAVALVVMKGRGGVPADGRQVCATYDPTMNASECALFWAAYNGKDLKAMVAAANALRTAHPKAAALLDWRILAITCGIAPLNDPNVFPYVPSYDYRTKPCGFGPGPRGLDASLPVVEASRVAALMMLTEADAQKAAPGVGLAPYLWRALAEFTKANPTAKIAQNVLSTRLAWLYSPCAQTQPPAVPRAA